MRRILIVEDEPVLRETYGIILSTGPYDLSVASDGNEALQLCKKRDFDLILLDMMMPVMDGLMFLQHLAEIKNPLPKIIIMSNLSSGEQIDKALALGAYSAVVKADLSPRDLLSLVRYEI